LSIRLRLTVWYVTVLAFTLIGGSVALYLVLSYSVLWPAQDELLASKANPLASTLALRPGQFQSGTTPRRSILPQFLNTLSEGNMLIDVRDADGAIVERSSNLLEVSLPLDPATLVAMRSGESRFENVELEGVRLRLYSTPVVASGQVVGFVQVARPTRELEETLGHLRNALLVGSAALILLGALAGWFLAGRSLQPVRRITRTAEKIESSGQLDRRVFYHGPRDELGELAVAFNNMLGRLEASFTAQRRFVADASHELRTPLTTLRVNLELLRKSRDAAPDGWAEVLDDLALELDRMTRLVEGLLRLERADAGYGPALQPLDLDPLLQRVERQLRQISNGVSLGLSGPEVGRVIGDADTLTQLFLILGENAVKYTPAGGSVRLERQRNGNMVSVRVVDSGPGISPEDLPRVFDRFYRAPAARGRAGTGLGLPIAKWIAEVHRGRLVAESDLSRGSTFTVLLPTSGDGLPRV
jgi:two-component system, OmpR family, sensor kinase